VARAHLAHCSKKKNPLYAGLIERITSTTFTRRMVGSCEPLAYSRVGHLPVFTIAFKFSPSLTQHCISTTAVHVIMIRMVMPRSFNLAVNRVAD
jgi:hypothetical protein